MENFENYEAMSKFRLEGEEKAQMNAAADMLIKSFEKLDNIDTEGVAPLVMVMKTRNVLRNDCANQVVSREELLSSAPEQYDGYFQVPKTLE